MSGRRLAGTRPISEARTVNWKGSERYRFGPFSCLVACGDRPPGMLERCDPGPGDPQGHALPPITRSRKRHALGQCQRLAVELQMGAGIVLEKPDDELRPVGAAIVPESRLCERGRRCGCHRGGA